MSSKNKFKTCRVYPIVVLPSCINVTPGETENSGQISGGYIHFVGRKETDVSVS